MSGSKSSAPAEAAEAASALGLTVHSMPMPDLSSRRTASGRLKMLMVLAVCATPVVASYFTYFVVKPQARTNYSELITPTREMPETLEMRNLAGQPVPSSSLRGQWLLVVVAGGACDALCEKQLYFQRQLRETLGRDKDRVDKLWLIPDAASPRPEVLAAISSGQPTAVLHVDATALAKWLAASPGQQLTDQIYLVDPMGQWMMRSPVNPDPGKLKRDLDRLLRASASWDQPGR
jgi:hypothetical protein